MKNALLICILLAPAAGLNLCAQTIDTQAATGNYVSDVGAIIQAQQQVLEQARAILAEGGPRADRAALEAAVHAMERAGRELAQARKSSERLPAAITDEEAAYQALLKAMPREYRMSRSRNRNKGGANAGQPNQQELDQLELTGEQNRYETERQAQASQTPEQREQADTMERLKQLARRQQDLNERLRDLQAALQEARTADQREEVQRQLKRLRDEERQTLANVDELRQRLEQSPNAAAQNQARQQLEQTRNEVQRASQELDRQAVSDALAAGARAEEQLQNLREQMRQQTSSQFANQMRQLRSQARDLSSAETQIGHDLETLNNSGHKSLDDAAQREALARQMSRQRSAFTNLIGQMRDVTEQAESTEPLLSKQLYDVLRRADQSHTENQLEVGAQLAERGFLPQAGQAEHAAAQNLEQLRQGVERAAESVLGSEAQALRYAQKELDDLANQVASEMKTEPQPAQSPPADQSHPSENSDHSGQAAGSGAPRQSPPDSQAQPRDGNQAQPRDGNQAQARDGNQAQAREGNQTQAQDGNPPQAPGRAPSSSPRPGSPSQTGANPAESGGSESLTQYAQDIGGAHGGLGLNGPITGNNYVDWTERLRDVEQALDAPDLRNQLATVRERVGVYRRAYRQDRRTPSPEELRNKVLAPLAMARNWVGQELARAQDERSLVPLDRDPVQDKYSELVRKYYEKLGSSQ